MLASEHLDFVGRLRELGGHERRLAVDEAVAATGPEPVTRRIARMVEDLLTSLADTAASGDLVAEAPASYPTGRMDSAWRKARAGDCEGNGCHRPTWCAARCPAWPVARSNEWRDRRIGGVPKDSIARVEIQRGANTAPKRRLTVFRPGGKPRLSLVFDSTKAGIWARADTGGTVWRLEPWGAAQITPAGSTLAARRKH
jgi:hypothetical protein